MTKEQALDLIKLLSAVESWSFADKQWWMKYWEVEISKPSEQDRKVCGDRACNVKARFKKNRFTGTVYVFRFNVQPEGNRWNEPGYGWGIWERL